MHSPDNIRRLCLLCGHSSFKHLYGKEHFLIKCRNCGLVSSEKIPTETELLEYYSEYPSYDKVSPLTIQRFNEILDRLEPFRYNNNLLETGCGFGFFLEAARKRNWNVVGTELSELALEKCREKNIPVSRSMDEFDPNGVKLFDVVVSIEVIEHVKDPANEISKYESFVRTNGALYITTPNFNSISRRMLGKKWNVIHYPEHLHYFTPGSIDMLLNKNSFQKISNQSVGFSPARLIYFFRSKKIRAGKEVENYDFNEVDRQLRDDIEKTLLLRYFKRTINFLLAKLRLGDSLKVLYQKKS
jgi:SAM-dependent methyltransferase